MKGAWLLLLLLPSLCAARIVQIEDMVKRERGCVKGTTIHETIGYWVTPERVWSSSHYEQRAVFRYQYGGVVKEGAQSYIKLVVRNLFLEDAVRRRRESLHNSKTGSLRLDLKPGSTAIELLVPVTQARAVFRFPVRVLTSSNASHFEVTEATLAIAEDRLVVELAAQRFVPTAELDWTPPKDWPSSTETIYLDRARGKAGGAEETDLAPRPMPAQ